MVGMGFTVVKPCDGCHKECSPTPLRSPNYVAVAMVGMRPTVVKPFERIPMVVFEAAIEAKAWYNCPLAKV